MELRATFIGPMLSRYCKHLVNRGLGTVLGIIVAADGRGHFDKLGTRPGDESMHGKRVSQPLSGTNSTPLVWLIS